MSFYKYKEREVDKTRIDWSGLTKTISDNLVAEQARRDLLKADIEQKHEEQLQKLNEYEQGTDTSMNEFALAQAQSTRDFLLQNHKLMKMGLRGVNDSKLIKQRVSDTWSTFNGAVKTYQENFKRLSELEGIGNEAVIEAMAKDLDLDNKKIYFDPNTGSGYYVDVDKNGDIDMSTARPVKAMNNLQNQEFEYVDVNKSTDEVVEKVADWKVFVNSTTDIEDARQNKAYKDWISNTVASALNSDQKIASVLMDYLGVEYDLEGKGSSRSVTYQRIKGYQADGRAIYEEVTETISDIKMTLDTETGKLKPELTDEQRKLAEAAYTNAIENKIGRKTSKQYVSPVSSGSNTPEVQSVGLLDDFLKTGNATYLNTYLGDNLESSQLSQDGSQLTIKLTDGQSTVIDMTRPQHEIGIQISGLLGQKYANAYRTRGRGNKSQPINPSLLKPEDFGTPVSGPIVDSRSVQNLDLILQGTDPATEESFSLSDPKKKLLEAERQVRLIARDLGLNPENIVIVDNNVIHKTQELQDDGTFKDIDIQIGDVSENSQDSAAVIVKRLEDIRAKQGSDRNSARQFNN